jgi:Mlc titration factor MtfA (ptsG expression regulator)
MLFSWFRNRRRRKLLAEPFPVRWEEFLRRNVAHFSLLPPPDQARLRDTAHILLHEKQWEGRTGLYVTEEMKVTIAGSAALLLLGDTRDYYANVESVIVYPSGFSTPVPDDDWEDDELSDSAKDGMAVYRGPVLLSWDHVLEEARDPSLGQNIVLHEFAHQLDHRDGASSGVPPLADTEAARRWKYVMTVAYEDHRRAIRKGETETFFSEQAADDEKEFFADATEAFYCSPHTFNDEYPEVYAMLAAYYRVDPGVWFRD